MNTINKLSIIALTMMILFASCDRNRKRLEQDVLKVNALCPMPITGGVCTSITLEDNYVVYKIIYDENGNGSFDVIRNNWADLKKALLFNLRSPNENIKSMMKTSITANVGLRLLFMGSKRGDRLNIEITPSEIEHGLNNTMSVTDFAKGHIQYEMQLFNLQCPKIYDNGLTLDSISIENNTIVYNVSFEGGQGTIELLKENSDKTKTDIEKEINHADKKLISLWNDANIENLNYRFTDNTTGKSMILSYTIQEIWHSAIRR